METQKCPRCHSESLYKHMNGIIRGDRKVYVRGLSLLTPASDTCTVICTECGHYENYIVDKSILEKIKTKWEKVE